MSTHLDDLLASLPAPSIDRSLDQLEPAVWRRIEAGRALDFTAGGTLRYQLVAAGMALIIGLAVGWSMNSARTQDANANQGLYASYAEVGPMARLSDL